jgi:hypothetical protein
MDSRAGRSDQGARGHRAGPRAAGRGAAPAPAPSINALHALMLQSLTEAVQLEAVYENCTLPSMVKQLRSPAPGAACGAVSALAAAMCEAHWGAAADALLADTGTVPVLLALLSGRAPAADGRTPFDAARVLGAMLHRARSTAGGEAGASVLRLVGAMRGSGAVPRLVELLRDAHGDELRRATGAAEALGQVCSLHDAAASEALGAGAWQVACRILAEGSPRFDEEEHLEDRLVSVLANLVPSRRRAPLPATATEPGLAAALAHALGRVAARQSSGKPLHDDYVVVNNVAKVIVDALECLDGAQCAAEFVRAGGARHLVSACQLGGCWNRGFPERCFIGTLSIRSPHFLPLS